MHRRNSRVGCHVFLFVWLVALLSPGRSWAQAQGSAPANASLEDSVVELQKQVRDLQDAVKEIHTEAARYRAEVTVLQQELESTRKQLAPGFAGPATTRGDNSAAGQYAAGDQGAEAQSSEQRLATLEEQQQLLSEKVNDQYQTKIESASKYRMKLSGIVLVNMFGNGGSVDNVDFPTTAAPRATLDSGGSIGGTVRQSQIGLEVFGPEFAGARTSAGVQFDFAGGFPAHSNGVAEGLVRLRTGVVRLDWKNTSVIAGQDGLFISPETPTSFASLAVPALAYAGNLWAWTPQLRVEHHIAITDSSSVLMQGGILDSWTGEALAIPLSSAAQNFRQPQFGERSRQPAYAARVAWTTNLFGRPLTVGTGGYFAHQNWGFRRNVDGWAGTSDWSLPVTRWFSVSGEFYRGRAVGGLGGALGRSTTWVGFLSNPATYVKGLDSLGGWTQLKFKPTDSRFEFNAAFGQENPFAHEVHGLSGGQLSYYDSVVRNQSALANVIYRPRSDLVFAVEYRRLHTFGLNRSSQFANHLDTTMGITF